MKKLLLSLLTVLVLTAPTFAQEMKPDDVLIESTENKTVYTSKGDQRINLPGKNSKGSHKKLEVGASAKAEVIIKDERGPKESAETGRSTSTTSNNDTSPWLVALIWIVGLLVALTVIAIIINHARPQNNGSPILSELDQALVLQMADNGACYTRNYTRNGHRESISFNLHKPSKFTVQLRNQNDQPQQAPA